MRVLFVEDESDTRNLVGAGLELHGFSVRLAADGVVAINALLEDRYDAIVTDINMPNGISGFDVAAEVFRIQPSAKVVLVSGYARAQLPKLPIGAHFLAKPYRVGDLARTLRSILAGPTEDIL